MEEPESGFEVEFVHLALLEDIQHCFGGTEFQTSLVPEIFPNSHESEPVHNHIRTRTPA